MLSMLILIVLVAVPITLITGKIRRDCTVYYPDKTSVFSIGLTVFCLIFFGVCVSTTLASGTDAYGYSGKYDERRHKGGDLYIVGYGMYGYPYGGRMGSRGNRGYMGGGLRGGK